MWLRLGLGNWSGCGRNYFWSVWPALSRRLGYGWRNLSYLAIALGFAALGVATALMHKPIDADSLPQGWIATGTVEQSRLTSGGTRVVAKWSGWLPAMAGRLPSA